MANPVRLAFCVQRCNARRRGIHFGFEFEEWCDWWAARLGPNWFRMRGRHRGQYVMARVLDRGDYAPDNVKCITANENQSENRLNGTSPAGQRHGGALLTDAQAKEIVVSLTPNAVAAAKYGVREALVRSIRNGSRWQHLQKFNPRSWRQSGRF